MNNIDEDKNIKEALEEVELCQKGKLNLETWKDFKEELDLDEDIEKVKKLIKILDKTCENNNSESARAVENVLSELRNLKWKNEIYVKSIKSHKSAIEKQEIELEKEKAKSKDLLRKLRNRVKEVKKLQQNPNYKSIVTKQNKTLEERAETIKSLKSELETYKKIAEKLAEEISCTDNYICKYFDAINECKYEARKDNTNTCKQCIIDWVRKEVTNDK